MYYRILICFPKYKKQLLNHLMIILQLCVRLNTKQLMEKDSLKTRLKTLSPKQLLQRLLIALVKLKAGKISENLLNEIIQIRF